jgi:micrococcal nuclease
MSDKDPYIYRIKSVLKVVDGDTIDASIDLGFDISLTKRIRLAGVDTPESRTTDVNEKKLGLEVKEWLKKKLEGQDDIIVKTELPDSTEKYGRILGHLFIGDKEVSAVNKKKSINQQMIDEGFAWTYSGGTKVKNFEELKEIRRQRGTLIE